MKGSRTGYRSGFDPRSIDGCQLWLDAADPTTLTLSGSNVTAWADKSGNGRNASAQVAATYSSASNALSFTGSNYYSFGDFSFAVGSYFSIFLVERLQSSSGMLHILGTDSTGANQGPHIRYNGTVNGTTNASAFRFAFYLNDLDAENNIAAFTTAAAQPIRIWSLVFTASFRGVYLNGTLIASDANNTTVVSWNTPLLGRSFGGYYYNGFLYEILGYGGQITTAQRQLIEGYLARKWGLQASINMLPNGHPYKYGTPGFVPTSISGCSLWLDAADTSTMTLSGSNVTQWNDKSGQGINFTAAGSSTAPVLSNYNGLPAIAWTGTTQQLTSISNNPTPGSAARSIFFVTHNPLSTSKIYAVTGTETGANPAIAWGYAKNANADYNYPFLYASAGTDIFSNVQIRDRATILTTTFDGTSNITGWINSDYQIAKTGGINTATTPWYLGLRPSGTGSLDSFLLEFLVYNTSLTAAQRQQVEGYLAWKWGTKTTTLPTTHPYVSIPPTLRPFAPVDVPGCSLWLDAADSTSISRAVTQWNDKSGNGNNAVAGTFTYPTMQTQSLNGLPIIRMRGSNDYFLVSSNFNMATYPSLAYTIVLRPASSQPNTTYAGVLSTDTPGQYGRTLGFGGGSYQQEYYSGFTNITPYTSEKWALVGLQFVSTTSATLTVNGTSYTGTASGSNNNTTGLKIGSYNNDVSYGTYNANFDVAEILIHGTSLSLSNRQQIEGYLAWKWGLQGSLPSGHPYLTAAPVGFTPTSVAGCQLWLDAADSTTVSLSSNVVSWNDKSGSNIVLSASSNFPTYGSAQINGVSALQFAGNSNRLEGAYSFATQTAMFIVYNTSNTTTASRTIDVNSNGYGNFGAPWVTSASTPAVSTDALLWLGGSNYPAQALYTTLTPQTGTRLYCAQFNGTSSGIWRNGTGQTLTGSGFAGPANGTLISVGGGVGVGNDPFSGSIGEILMYKAVLTTAQRQQIEGYLARKWGLQSSLSNPHPYRYNRPFGFTPTSIAGCALWLDAADASSITLSGSNVTAWNDKSGSSNNPTFGSIKPTYSNNQVTTAYLDSTYTSNKQFSVPASVLSTSAGSAGSLFFVYADLQPSNFYSGLYGVDNGSPGNFYQALKRPDSQSYAGLGYGTASPPTLPASFVTAMNTTNTVMYNMNYTYASTTGSVRVNGTSQITPLGTITPPSNPLLISAMGFGDGGSLRLSEIIAFKSQLTTAQIQQIEGYLAWKWGLQRSLPSGHPYQFGLPPLTAGFRPPALTSPVLWLDAAQDGAANGSYLNTIQDRSPSGYSVTAVTTNTVTMLRSGLNGLPVYNLGANRLTIGSFGWRAKFTLVLVSQSDFANVLISQQVGGTYYAYAQHANWYLLKIPNNMADLADAAYSYNSGLLANGFGWSIAIWQYDLTGSAPTWRLNGTARTTSLQNGSLSTADQSSTQPLWINGNASANGGSIRIAELLHFNDSFTTAQLQQLEGYLAHKWGIQNVLPTNHPYRTLKP